jgi:hypothetical protein
MAASGRNIAVALAEERRSGADHALPSFHTASAQSGRSSLSNTGPRPTAGWALQRWLLAIHGSATPTGILGGDVATAPALGVVCRQIG